MTKPCKQCKTRTEAPVQTPRGAFCDYECAMQWGRQKSKEAADRKAERELKKKLEPYTRKPIIQKKESELSKAQRAINAYVRERDYGKPCPSCGRSVVEKTRGGEWDCGHYLGRGRRPNLRFNLWNMHRQCKTCNGGSNKYAHKAESVEKAYRINLIERIGLAKVEWLEANHEPTRYRDADYIRIGKIFRKKTRRLLARRQ